MKSSRIHYVKREEYRKGVPFVLGSLLATLIGVGGLILGYYLGDSPAGHAVAGGAPVLKGSLPGAVIEIFQGSISLPEILYQKGLAGFIPLILYLSILYLCAMECLSIFMTLFAILSPSRARRLFRQNARHLFLAYGLIFAGNFVFRSLSLPSLSREFFDFSALIPACAELILLLFFSLLEHKWEAGINLLLFMLSLFSTLAVLIPGTPLVKYMNDLVYSNGGFSPETQISLLVFCGVLGINLLFSVYRLSFGLFRFFDVSRFGLQLICSLGLLGTHLASGNIAFITAQPLSAALLLFCPLLGLTLSLSARRVRRRMKQIPDFPDPILPVLLLPPPEDEIQMPRSA